MKRLPLGAREAFFFSQLDGHLTLEETSDIAGLGLDEACRLAHLLLGVGAVELADRTPPRSVRRNVSAPPKPSLQPDRRKTRPPSLRAQRVSRAPAAECELDAAMLTKLSAMEERIGKVDLYTLLDVDRSADKKAIKRAYYALASTFHPDRFFGKKLGAAKTKVERVFHALTEAHDTLANAARREQYDATLPRAPKRPSIAIPRRSLTPASPAVTGVVRKALTRQPPAAPKTPSRQPPSSTKAPPSAKQPSRQPPSSKAPSSAKASSRRSSVPRGASKRPPETPTPTPTPSPELARARAERLKNAARELTVQAKVDLLVKAADEALRSEDIVGAANNYRLALSHRDDLHLRLKYEELDARARVLRFEKNIAPAKAAEKEGRWADAAVFLLRAHEAKPDAEIASRAAHAMRASGGDLQRAVALAEQAVHLDDSTIGYRITLIEVCIAANRLARAEEVCEEALLGAPKDTRLKKLATEIAEKQRATSKR